MQKYSFYVHTGTWKNHKDHLNQNLLNALCPNLPPLLTQYLEYNDKTVHCMLVAL